MTPADEMGFDNQFEDQLRAIVKEASLQPRLVEDLHGSEDTQSLLFSLLSRHLDHESSERRAIYRRLQTIENARDQADDHQLDAAAWLGEATLVLDGIFGGLRDVRFTPKGGHQSVYGYTPLIAVCAGGSNIATIRLLAQRGHRSQGQARLLPPLNFGNPLSEYIYLSRVFQSRGPIEGSNRGALNADDK